MSASGGEPTLEEVAVRAGVGRGTASRVINGSPQVSDRSREAVLQAIDELGYVPNQAARTLVTRRTGTIALVIAESEERIFGEPFFAGVVRGISTALNEASRQLVLSLVQNDDQAGRMQAYLTRQHVDGMLLLSLHDDGAFPLDLEARGLPTVLGGRSGRWTEASYVDVDNRGGAAQAVDYLIGKGYTSIGTVTGPRGMASGRDRYDGYLDALAAAGVELDHELVEGGDFSEPSGFDATTTLLARRPDLDAVFVASDPMAAGALRALRGAGRRTPEDVAVVGFDGTPFSESTDPPLTTIRQPLDRLGREMVTMLLDHIENPDAKAERLILPVELVVRDSA